MKTHVTVWCGDSITAGNHLNPGEVYVDLVAADFGDASSTHNLAGGGAEVNETQGAAADALYDASAQANICLVAFGPNDIADVGVSAFLTNLQTFCGKRHLTGFTVIVLTILPFTTVPGGNANRNIANAVIRTATYWDYLIDRGDITTTMGADAACDNPTLYLDGIHPNAYGNTLLVPGIESVLRPLLFTVGWRGVS